MQQNPINPNYSIAAFGAFLGLTGVLLGAFGAHGLKSRISAEALQSYQTGVRYQEIHALLLLFLALAGNLFNEKLRHKISWLIISGVLLFSGSIYLVAIAEHLSFPRWIYLITPVGGTILIICWLLLFIQSLKNLTKN